MRKPWVYKRTGIKGWWTVLLMLRHFKRIVGPNSSKEITQQNLDTFVLKRSEEVGKNTLNKDIRNLHAFLNWAVKNRFVASGLEIKKVKVPQIPVVSLSPKQVRDLITLTSRYPTLRLRVLLAVTTGLRRGDSSNSKASGAFHPSAYESGLYER